MGKSIADQEVNTVDASKVIGRSAECLRRLMEAGLSYADLQRPIDDPEMRDRLVRFWKSGGRKYLFDRAIKGVVRLFVDYTRSLAEMLKDGRFDSVNSDITENHFPITKRPNGEVEMKLFHFNRAMDSDEAIKEMDKEGYRPAELPEGLAYAKANPDEQRRYPIALLGSVWQDWGGDRSVPYVPCLCGDGGGRVLHLGWFEGGWSSLCRFLAVRK